jgi:predicted dehydrogenase
MNSIPIRIAILGAGGILGAHAAGIRAAGEACTVVAVARANPVKVEDVHRFFGPEVEVVGDNLAVIVRDDIDAIINLLPHDLHMETTIAAARAGKHVLVEKVMARNVWECDRMIEACEAAGVNLTVAHDRRYQPHWMALKRVVDSGILGEIYQLRLEHNQDVAVPPTSWIFSRDQLGGGAVMSCLTHQIDALRWYGGEVAGVTAMSKVIPDRMEGETMGVIAARMASGALAHVAINWATRGGWSKQHCLPGEFTHITGSKGEAYYVCGQQPEAFVMLYAEPELASPFTEETPAANTFARITPLGSWTGHERCVTEWLKLLRGEPAEVTTPGRDSRQTVEVAEAAYRAEARGCVVQLPITPEPWEQ